MVKKIDFTKHKCDDKDWKCDCNWKGHSCRCLMKDYKYKGE